MHCARVIIFRGSAKLEIIHKGALKGKTFLKCADALFKRGCRLE